MTRNVKYSWLKIHHLSEVELSCNHRLILVSKTWELHSILESLFLFLKVKLVSHFVFGLFLSFMNDWQNWRSKEKANIKFLTLILVSLVELSQQKKLTHFVLTIDDLTQGFRDGLLRKRQIASDFRFHLTKFLLYTYGLIKTTDKVILLFVWLLCKLLVSWYLSRLFLSFLCRITCLCWLLFFWIRFLFFFLEWDFWRHTDL